MAASHSVHVAAPQTSDLQAPTPPATFLPPGPAVTPEQVLFFYSADEWEQFILEWCTTLTPNYAQIKRLGGSGDMGVDVAGFRSTSGFQGPWDCYQCKHYAAPLQYSDAFPEMLKMLRAVVAGHYLLPGVHAFAAPKGSGGGLSRLLSSPSKLKKKFLDSLSGDAAVVTAVPADELAKVRALAETLDFTSFRSMELHEILTAHRSTPYYTVRFGTHLGPREKVGPPPAEVAAEETGYVQQLLEIYAERHQDRSFLNASAAASDPDVQAHFLRQRVSFFSAEALRVYARDSVPPGTFEVLQEDIYSGVVEVLEADHPSGMVRLRETLKSSVTLDLQAHTLMTVGLMDDRKGICHQLANDGRVRWIPRAPQ